MARGTNCTGEVYTAAVAVPYHAELEKVFLEEFDNLMLSGGDIDTTIRNTQEKVQKIIRDAREFLAGGG
ncbi:hypothetical protein [Paenibacillus harenae]|uniref:Uncharacterized protein n=1 Tax=Paenibacillus harenae TaxID=306543 RepID=A0ABT9U5I4_PAEHA|nr:hypothetical protein [Paenibacillus harenae]MDQ0113669.1 hypothetical protein [Paenibacillus harenae]